MNDTLASLPMLIEVLSPVHIGTGEELDRKAYVPDGDQVHVVDERKLLSAIGSSRQLRHSFLSFCERSEADLGQFLRSHRIPVGEVRSYTLRRLGRSPYKLLPFIKSAGNPPRVYVPGSSLKGALRSALFRGALLDDKRLRDAAADRVRTDLSLRDRPNSPGRSAEQVLFGPDQHHDLMRILQVADSRLVPPSRLRAAEVRTLSLRQGRLQELRFILSPEVLPEGTRLRTDVVFNAYLLSMKARSRGLGFGGERARQRLLDFIRECNRAAENIISQEITFFQQYGKPDMQGFYRQLQERLSGLGQMQCLLRLGWGTGFDDKAVTDVFDEQLFDDVRNAYGLKVGRPGRRGPGLPKALSPKSRKIAFRRRGPPQPLGWVLLRML